jgi:micrococcal nuclease
MTAREFQRPDYTYLVTVDRVIDADTIDVHIDVGFKTTIFKRLRLLEFDAEEIRDPDPARREDAHEATARLQTILDEADKVYIQTVMDAAGKYGRLLAWVWVEKDGELSNANLQMIDEGYQKKPRS